MPQTKKNEIFTKLENIENEISDIKRRSKMQWMATFAFTLMIAALSILIAKPELLILAIIMLAAGTILVLLAFYV